MMYHLTLCLYGDEPPRRLELELGEGLHHVQLAGLQQRSHHADGVVPREQRVDTVLLSDDVPCHHMT